MKHYRIRRFSLLWWVTRVGAVTISILGAYSYILILSIYTL